MCLIRFGDEQRVVYKPKPQAGSAAWQELLGWCAEQPALGMSNVELGVRVVIDRGDYGWDQTLGKDTAAVSADEAGRWLRSYGVLIRLLEVVEAADMWFDNLVTSAGLPQFIDVETDLQPRVAGMSRAATLLAETCAPGGAVSLRLALPDGDFEDLRGLRPVTRLRLPFTERMLRRLLRGRREKRYGIKQTKMYRAALGTRRGRGKQRRRRAQDKVDAVDGVGEEKRFGEFEGIV